MQGSEASTPFFFSPPKYVGSYLGVATGWGKSSSTEGMCEGSKDLSGEAAGPREGPAAGPGARPGAMAPMWPVLEDTPTCAGGAIMEAQALADAKHPARTTLRRTVRPIVNAFE